MTAPTEPLKLVPGRRYLIRRGSWSTSLEEVKVVARSKTGVYLEHESGRRRWHMLAYAGVGSWVIEEDLGAWSPNGDPAAELRAAVKAYFEAVHEYELFRVQEGDGPYPVSDEGDRFMELSHDLANAELRLKTLAATEGEEA